jgi:hypothetical protein
MSQSEGTLQSKVRQGDEEKEFEVVKGMYVYYSNIYHHLLSSKSIPTTIPNHTSTTPPSQGINAKKIYSNCDASNDQFITTYDNSLANSENDRTQRASGRLRFAEKMQGECGRRWYNEDSTKTVRDVRFRPVGCLFPKEENGGGMMYICVICDKVQC